jgi:hippurate hydrolase
MNGIDALLASSKDDLATLRRDLHAHPELRFEEHRTADIVAAELERLGYTVDRGMGASARPE